MNGSILKLTSSLLFIFIYSVIYSQFEPENFEFENADSVINYLEGEWEWTKSCDGQWQGCTYPETEGYSRAMVFKRIENFHDSIEYEVYIDDILQENCTVGLNFIETRIYGWAWTIDGIGYIIEKITETEVVFRTLYRDDRGNWFKKNVPLSAKNEPIVESRVRVYPNPCSNYIKIKSNDFGGIDKCAIYNTHGQEILVHQDLITNEMLDVSGIPKGLYFVRVVVGDVEYVEKFIKE